MQLEAEPAVNSALKAPPPPTAPRGSGKSQEGSYVTLFTEHLSGHKTLRISSIWVVLP